MKFVEEGKIDLDKPLYEYVPYPAFAHDDRYKKITGRMVLIHRSGFPNWRENEVDKKLKIKFEPGTQVYSVRNDSTGLVLIDFHNLKHTGIIVINKAITNEIRIISKLKSIR